MFHNCLIAAFLAMNFVVKVFIECFTDFPAHSGVVLSLEEVEGGMKGMKLQSGPQPRRVPQQARGDGTPFMAEHLEEALTGGSSARPRSRDPDMSAFNKLVSSMQASGTLPTHAKGSTNNVSLSLELLSLKHRCKFCWPSQSYGLKP